MLNKELKDNLIEKYRLESEKEYPHDRSLYYYIYRLHPDGSREGLRENFYSEPGCQFPYGDKIISNFFGCPVLTEYDIYDDLYITVEMGNRKEEILGREPNGCIADWYIEPNLWAKERSVKLNLTKGEFLIGPYITIQEALDGANLMEELL